MENISNKELKIERIGERNIANNGQMMEIIMYRNANDIDVRFEDGTEVTNKQYRNFKAGSILNPNEHMGEKNLASNGQMMEIIACRNAYDIDVRFEDGTMAVNRTYANFKSGRIANPNINPAKESKTERIGEIKTANNGQMMKIIAYKNNYDIDVCFEDGTIVRHKQYVNFKDGKIANPNTDSVKASKTKRIRERNIANNGQTMEIIAYRSNKDIDVRFEDGTVVCNKEYGAFKNGHIANPNTDSVNVLKVERLGETNIANNGQMMEIIAYRSSKDMDVRFEDGTVVRNKIYRNFKSGYIANPNANTNTDSVNVLKAERLGETNIANNGQMMKIIAYRSNKDIDVRFEDGTEVFNKRYAKFKSGSVGNPNLKKNAH